MRIWKIMGILSAAAVCLTACTQASGATEGRLAFVRAVPEADTTPAAAGNVLRTDTTQAAARTVSGTGMMQAAGEEQSNGKTLIAYFTWADNTVVTDQDRAVASAMEHYEAMGDASRYGTDAISSASLVQPGNTAMIADWIHQETGGDLFSIQTVESYPSDYNECMDRASEERAHGTRPELKSQVEGFDEYETIFIGFPNWWSSLPMPVVTFLESYDFSGKMVVPFCAHGTGGIGATVRELERALPETAVVYEPLGIYRADILQAQPKVEEWLREQELVPIEDQKEQAARPVEQGNGSDVLIAYFSRVGNTEYPEGTDANSSASMMVRGNERYGITEYAARLIQNEVGGRIHLIQTRTMYPADFDETVEQNHREIKEGVIPELKEDSLNMEDYKTVFIGYPVWAATIPQAVRGFLQEYDFSGKTVVPFCTHQGYGAGGSYEDIANIISDSNVLEGIAFDGDHMEQAEMEVEQWILGLGLS